MPIQSMKDAAKELLKTFKAQKAEKVYVVACCGRVYVGLQPAQRCRTCDRQPENAEVANEADLDNLILT